MSEVIAEYKVKVNSAVSELDAAAKAWQKVDDANTKANKTASDGFIKGSDGAKRLNAELQKQPKTLAELELKLQKLRELLRDDTEIGTKGFKQVTAEIKNTEKAINAANGKLEETGKKSSGLIDQFKKLGALLGVTFAVERLVSFGKEAAALAAEGEGVRNAFEKLNDPNLLNNLRAATRGTLSELELMAKATFAKQMGIELEKLPKILEFARRVAKDTGKDFEFLSEQIVVGIGRKSTQRLDDFGITSDRLKAKLKGLSLEAATTGQVASAVLEIATEEMARMGDETVTSGDMLKQYRADWLDLKEAIGVDILSQLQELNSEISKTGELLNVDVSGSGIIKFFSSNLIKALLEPFTLINWNIQEAGELFQWFKSFFSDGDLEAGSKQLTDIQKGFAAIRAELDKSKKESEDDSDSLKKQIRNVFLLENAIKTLKDERAKEGTQRKRIFEINKLLIPLEEELAILLGKETDEQKKLREELEKIAKIRAQVFTGAEMANGIPVVVALSSTIKGLNDLLKEQRDILNTSPEFSQQYKDASIELDKLQKKLDEFNDDFIDPSQGFEGVSTDGFLGGVFSGSENEFDKQKEMWYEYASVAQGAISAISSAQNKAAEYELSVLDNALRNGEITREKYDQRRKEILTQQAEDNKAVAIANATINAISAAVAALGSTPFTPANIALAAIVGALGLAEVATIAATPIPTFKDGGMVKEHGLLKGKSHAQGGIPIEAEGNEYFMPTKQTLKNYGLLEAMRKGIEEQYILKHYKGRFIDDAIFSGFADIGKSAELNNLTVNFKDHNLIHSDDKTRSTIRNGFKFLAKELKKENNSKRGGYRA